MPIGFYGDKGEKRFIGDCDHQDPSKLTAYFSSISSTSFRNIVTGDNYFKPDGSIDSKGQ